ncbi:glutamate-5-semialdehyde dehydrogenase [Streptomyces tendae]|uniref:glutamate-5-semialdehyde dehydrogenase n=1 Tax=Streptomyces tendae TaxID=1932 RepID=UPI00249253EC|nr:glutamate-5-semialdehyde dehydrogenase [Streptomyces tendae]
MTVMDICRAAKEAAADLRLLNTAVKNRALEAMAGALEAHREDLIKANAVDIEKARATGVSPTLIDRLTLNDKRIAGMVNAIRVIAGLADPVGLGVGRQERPNGLVVEQVREPLGVVAVIYEARPNVTADVAALCLKSGNAAVLRGSSIAYNSNAAITEVLHEALRGVEGIPGNAVQLVHDVSREGALELLKAKGYVDLLVPRGGPELIRTVEENATVPTVIDGDGNCHIYVDAAADLRMATDIAVNAKTSRPSVCNAMETLLVHQDVAREWLPVVLQELGQRGVEIRGCERVRDIVPSVDAADETDWGTEYLDLVLAVKVVDDLDAAIAHIGTWGTMNADGIVTQDIATAQRFTRAVSTGSVFVNTSTRYSDGGEFGYGVEIGVSTQKLHSRGPMGLESLTSVKNVVWGNGQVRVL